MNKTVIVMVVLCLFIGGCTKLKELYQEPKTVRVQDYTGENYPGAESKEAWDYIAEHKEELSEYAIKYYKEEYGLDVKVNNMYPSKKAAIATVETIKEPFIRATIIMQLNKKEGMQLIYGVYETQMETEKSILCGLYYMAFEEEFKNLEAFMKRQAEQYPITGTREEVIKNIGYSSYQGEYFYFSTAIAFPKTYELFMENHEVSKEELRSSFLSELEILKKKRDQGDIFFPVLMTIKMYMDEVEDPDEKIAMEILENLKKEENIPYGNYAVLLYGNLVNSDTGRPVSEVVGNKEEDYLRY